MLDVSDFKHFRINHSKLFADHKNHINGIENFWNQAKRHMRKCNGVPKVHFGLYLKECEWRFNNSDPSSQLKQLRQWVKGDLNSLSGTAPKSIIGTKQSIKLCCCAGRSRSACPQPEKNKDHSLNFFHFHTF